MKTTTLFAVLSLAFAGTGAAQLELPVLSVFNYSASPRDPFISAQAQTTLLDPAGEVRGIVAGDVVQKYLDAIVSAIKDQFEVGGVSVGENPQNSEALINGVTFHPGERIPLALDPNQLGRLLELSRAYGLPLQLNSDGAISIVIGRINAAGVDLLLPGFEGALTQLPMASDTRPDPIKLERRGKTR